MKTATTPYGRMPQWPDGTPNNGFPLQITQLLAQLPGTRYVTRQAVFSPAAVRNAKKAIKKAFQNQIENKNGVNFVEIVSNCNSNWKMSAVDANKWLQDNMLPVYPLGDLKDNFELIKK